MADNGIFSKNGRKRQKGLLSGAYKDILKKNASEDIKNAMGLEDGATYADAIASQVVKRAIGLVPDDKICFRAITELRETTEGKTAEKIIASGENSELTNLALLMRKPPAPPDGEDAAIAEDNKTEEAENDFHNSGEQDE